MFSCPANFEIGDILQKIIAQKQCGPLFYLGESDGTETLAWGAVASGSLAWAEERSGPVFGGISFWGEWRNGTENPWQGFSPEFFFEPLFLLRKRSNGTFLSISPTDTKSESELLSEWEALRNKSSLEYSHLGAVAIERSAPALEEWLRICEIVKASLESSELQKLVLARRKMGALSGTFPASFLFRALLELPSLGVHKFAFRENNDVFFGASPEYLFRFSKNYLHVPAVAGTRPRGADSAQDKELEKELLNSLKERKEHSLVVKFLREKIQSFGIPLPEEAEPSVRKLSRLQHLYTALDVKCSDPAKPLHWLRSLHPTPAMAGFPQKKACEILHALEKWERGYFASPLGFFLPDEERASFIVGIRALLLSNNSFQVFSGAGFMPDSMPEAEWAETEEKMQTILQLFDRGRL